MFFRRLTILCGKYCARRTIDTIYNLYTMCVCKVNTRSCELCGILYINVPSFKMLSNILYASPLSSRTEAAAANGDFLVPSSNDLDRFRNCPSLGTSNRQDALLLRFFRFVTGDDDTGGINALLLVPVSAR